MTQTDAPDTTATLIRVPMPVRWRDLDAFNHVNNATYLTYLEQARLDWLQHLDGIWRDDHSAPVMAACQLNYRAPIHWPADIHIELHCQRLGNRSVTIGHRIIAADDTQRVYCDGNVTLVWIDPASGQPVALPQVIRDAVGQTR